ncbi:hypothetical protein NCAS_0B00330 [Naumovozyma castellii]|uniref:Uncharacterized protein n=1 Tax=Naumovozyma castellii TaxID=27288 RepID=G0VAZ4_NAUCA|nr:hypothetical protein NCAS_0B00330 [Naumovozyma castellii CBS 4309]CCC68117.1 hypothetical protein NCAS_0B00330 [Naumovozyma castellii CBS 4309]
MAKTLAQGRKPGSGRKPGKAKTLREGRKPGSGRKRREPALNNHTQLQSEAQIGTNKTLNDNLTKSPTNELNFTLRDMEAVDALRGLTHSPHLSLSLPPIIDNLKSHPHILEDVSIMSSSPYPQSSDHLHMNNSNNPLNIRKKSMSLSSIMDTRILHQHAYSPKDPIRDSNNDTLSSNIDTGINANDKPTLNDQLASILD